MKMADKNIGSIGIYKHDGGKSGLRFGEHMRIGCDIGYHLVTTKKWIAMIEYDSKVAKAFTFLCRLTYGNILYLWYRLTKKGI